VNLPVLGVGKVVRELAGVLSAWSANVPLSLRYLYLIGKDEEEGGEEQESE
jgi:hypothetical protein